MNVNAHARRLSLTCTSMMLASSYSQRRSTNIPAVVYSPRNPVDSNPSHLTPVIPTQHPPTRPKSANPAYYSQGHASFPPTTYNSQSSSLGRVSGRRAKTPSHHTPERPPTVAPASQTKSYERWLPPSPAPSHTHAPSGRALYSSKRRSESTTPTPTLGSASTSINSNTRRRTGSTVGVAMASLVSNLGASSIQRASTAAPPSYQHDSELPSYSYTKPPVPVPSLPEWVGAMRMRSKLSGGGLSTASAAAAAVAGAGAGENYSDELRGAPSRKG